MIDGAQSVGRAPLSLAEWLLVLVAGYLVVLKLYFSLAAFPIADEAYYWMWGQHPAWSYFDHPPLQGWVQGLSHSLFGRSLFALRWPSIAAFVGTVWIYLDLARRLAGAGWRPVFLKGLVVYLAAPMFGLFGSVVFNDYLMVFLALAAGYLFMHYFGDVEAGGDGRRLHLFGAAALLGLAALAKYNGALLGIAVAATILLRPRLRPLLLRPELYLAASLAIAIQAPVLAFALQTDFASFRFHLAGRFAGRFSGIDPQEMASAAIGTLTMLSPFLVPALLRFFVGWRLTPFERPARVLALLVFVLSTVPLLYLANFATILPWWNIAAFVLALPFLGRHVDRVSLTLHALYGTAFATLFVVNFTLVPVNVLWGGRPFYETEHAFGWTEVGAAVTAAQRSHGTQFLATNRYQTASQLAFALDDSAVVALSSRRDAFDDWFDPVTRQGQSAIVLVDGRDDMQTFRLHFEQMREIGTVTAGPFGHQLLTYTLYLGEGFRPLPDDG
ncbi:MAG: glycosyltransferase family 39 protein [Devosia sp.]|nr:glycosyltransferase family 39 protein [Devosia sp.]